MATLQEQFDQAVKTARSGTNPPAAEKRQAHERLEALYRQATAGDAQSRDDAMRQYIELVGDLGQQDA